MSAERPFASPDTAAGVVVIDLPDGRRVFLTRRESHTLRRELRDAEHELVWCQRVMPADRPAVGGGPG